jgi:hypothetical protein
MLPGHRGGSATYVELLDGVSAVDQRTSPTRLILASRAGHGYSTLVTSMSPPRSRSRIAYYIFNTFACLAVQNIVR